MAEEDIGDTGVSPLKDGEKKNKKEGQMRKDLTIDISNKGEDK